MALPVNAFGSPDSKYFIRTAFKVLFVPLATMALAFYSLWMYLSLNFYFFTSKGFVMSGEMKEAFIDRLMNEQIDALPWIGIFLIVVYFLGLFLAHLVLRPFTIAAKICRDAIKDETTEVFVGGLSKHQLVIKTSALLVGFIRTRDNHIPDDLNQIQKPKLDYVFYFQYTLCVLILSIITASAIYVGLHLLHDSIVATATEFIKTDQQVTSFLLNQQDLIASMGYICTAFSLSMYILIAHGVVKDVEGVSYAYLRDVKKVIGGDYGRRLQPRFVDPGAQAALALNQVLDHYFPNNVMDDSSEVAPPPLPTKAVGEEKVFDQNSIERLFNSKGKVI